MDFNDSHKQESGLTSMKIGPNNSVMLSNLDGSPLEFGIPHGEGKFGLPLRDSDYQIAAKYAYGLIHSTRTAVPTILLCW